MQQLTDHRRLPDEVRARLTKVEAPGADGYSVVKRGRVFEARRSTQWEMRASADDLNKALTDRRGEIPIVGYAASYEQPYPVYGGPPSGWEEVMAGGSWARTISQGADIRFLMNHDGMALARTGAGTMKLSSDDVGLLVDATLDMRSGNARDLAVAIERGDMSQMSCAFEVTKQSWSPDNMQRRVDEVIGYDVSVVTYPANEATMVLVQAASPVAAGPVASDDEPGMQDCPNCGASVPSDETQCPDCGYELGADRSVRRGISLRMAQAQADQLRLPRAG